jgi:peptide/nickel transport system substrate-binding protein
VFNLDPCECGITFNTAKFPFDNKDVRWALTLAIDIVSYITTAYDGAATMSCLHVSAMPLLVEKYYDPMQTWLKEFTLDLGGGETFNPYDPDAPQRLADYAEGRGYAVAPEDIKGAFGSGWWKHAPDAAAKLLEKNGFGRDEDGNWLLPDGTPWKFTILTSAQPGHPMTQNAFAARYEWRKFGIDVDVVVDQMANSLYDTGDFDVCTAWPSGPGSWGGHVDLFRDFDDWNSAYIEPLGEITWAHCSRWSHPRMDEIIAELKVTDWWGDVDEIVELGTEGLKLVVEEMGPGIGTFTYPGVFTWDTYYWTNWPGAENPYTQPYPHWPNLKYQLPFLEPTGN